MNWLSSPMSSSSSSLFFSFCSKEKIETFSILQNIKNEHSVIYIDQVLPVCKFIYSFTFYHKSLLQFLRYFIIFNLLRGNKLLTSHSADKTPRLQDLIPGEFSPSIRKTIPTSKLTCLRTELFCLSLPD